MQLKMSDLETERLLLREFRPADLAGVGSWQGKAHAEQFLEFCFRSYKEWGMGPWALTLKKTEVIVGHCGYCRIAYDRRGETLEYSGEVNYYVAPQHRSQGFATEALQAVLRYGFDALTLTRIQGRCSPENVPSERVLRKAGLKFDRMVAAAEGLPEEKLHAITREEHRSLPSRR